MLRIRRSLGGESYSIDLELMADPRFFAADLSHSPTVTIGGTPIELSAVTIAGTPRNQLASPIRYSFRFPVGTGTHPGPLPRLSHARVVLRPDAMAASRRVDITEMWAEEIDLGWVLIKWELDPIDLGEVQQVPEAVGEPTGTEAHDIE